MALALADHELAMLHLLLEPAARRHVYSTGVMSQRKDTVPYVSIALLSLLAINAILPNSATSIRIIAQPPLS
jgi:hypothetical protein